MARKWKMVKLPFEAFESYNHRINELKKTVEKVTKKPAKISFANGMRFLARKPTATIYDDEILDYFKNWRKKGGRSI